MADLEKLGRRLNHILERDHPNISQEDRDKLIQYVVTNLLPTDNLEAFWKGFYGVPL